MELKGRIDQDLEFLADTDEGEMQCLLFTSPEDSEEDPEEFDLAGYQPGLVTVTCESFDGDDAWGVTEVVARADDDGDKGEEAGEDDTGESADEEAADEDAAEEPGEGADDEELEAQE
jgi:hypothetical protein